MCKRHINDLKSICPCAFLSSFEHLKSDVDRVLINKLKIRKMIDFGIFLSRNEINGK